MKAREHITVSEILNCVEKLTGHSLNSDEGVLFGDKHRRVKGVTISWMASPEAIIAAGKVKHDLLITHETLYYPHYVLGGKQPEGWENWEINKQRRRLLEKYNLVCVRLHGSADQICIYDCFAELLGLKKVVGGGGYCRIFEIRPCTLRQLITRVKKQVGIKILRVAARDLNKKVSLIGLPWGGLGLFVNVSFQQDIIRTGHCDVFIAGESDSYGFRFALENNIPMIETSHEASENPGLRKFTTILASAFPSIKFAFHNNECAWQPI